MQVQSKTLKEYLNESNSQLLADFKCGNRGANDFSNFMRLVRELHTGVEDLRKEMDIEEFEKQMEPYYNDLEKLMGESEKYEQEQEQEQEQEHLKQFESIPIVYDLTDMFFSLKEGQVAKATFGNDHWFITMSSGFIRYCNEDGTDKKESVPLTNSNLKASYEIIN